MKFSLKKSVKCFGTQNEMIICDLVMISVFEEFGRECVITSICDGKHGDHSHHYKGFARDYRIRHVPIGWWDRLAQRARGALSDEFQVVLHKGPKPPPHLHVEFDPL